MIEDKYKSFDMDKAIHEAESKCHDDECVVFALGAGRMIPFVFGLKKNREMEEAFDYIKKLEGFLGVHPVDLWHTLLIFDTLENAKSGRNLLKFKGVSVGRVAPIIVPKIHAERRKND